MTSLSPSTKMFRAAPIVARQLIIAAEKPEIPASYRMKDLGGLWLGADSELSMVSVWDAKKRFVGLLVGHIYSEFDKAFLEGDDVTLPLDVVSLSDLELLVMPHLAGMFVFLTAGDLPHRLYMDHGGSFPVVYSPSDRRAATSVALLLDEKDYAARFLPELHDAMIGREVGGWIGGTLTAHAGVHRVLPNHYLDFETWTTSRFWPRPGDFDTWRDFDSSVEAAAAALDSFSAAASRRFDLATALTAGFDTRLLVASCRTSLPRTEFFTIEAPDAEMDINVSAMIAQRFGLKHRVMPLSDASAEEMAIWDRMVSDCVMEAPRRTHTTLRRLEDRNAIFTGVYGEVGRCRIYRQDGATINSAKIDARFIIDRLTLPAPREAVENVEVWLAALQGQPNSVILDLAYLELKCGSWAMGQRPISNSVKLHLMPITQRPVFEAFIGVAPTEKGTAKLFSAVIEKLWPELMSMPINKYGDFRDQLHFLKKFTKPHRIRRYLRNRFAKLARA